MSANEPEAHVQFLRMEFEEYSKLLHAALEWRHKILTHYVAALGAVFLGLKWAYESHRTGLTTSGLGLGFTISVAAALMDRVNQKVLIMCYEQGAQIETKLGAGSTLGIFGSLEALFVIRPPLISYRRLLAILYWGAATAFLAALTLSTWSQ